MLHMQGGFKTYQGTDGEFMVKVKPWMQGELMIDFYYQNEFIHYLHRNAEWSDIFGSEASTDYIISLMEGSEKLLRYVPMLRGMVPLREDWLLEYLPESGNFLIQVYVEIPNGEDAVLRVNEASVYCREERRRLCKARVSVRTYQKICACCEQVLATVLLQNNIPAHHDL